MASSTTEPADNPEVAKILADLDDFAGRMLSPKFTRNLQLSYRYSEAYDQMWYPAWEEYDGLEEARKACGAPREDWQDTIETWRREDDELRARDFVPDLKGLDAKLPLASAMKYFLVGELHEDVEIDRWNGWKTTLASWNRLCELYESSPKFRSELSPMQKSSFLVLNDWWNARYSPKRDIEAMHDSLAVLVSKPSMNAPTGVTFGYRWTSHTHYHSACLELFMRELHPMEWEPYVPRPPLLTLVGCRQVATKHAINMRFAYAALSANADSISLREYPQPVRDTDGWKDNILFEEPPVGETSQGYYTALLDMATSPPRYLWDVAARKAIRVMDYATCPDYVCVSHTWGRWCVRPPSMIEVPGVPWKVKENTLYDVRHVPDMLRGLKSDYVWLDLFCLPQDDSPEHHDEVANQTAIFRRAKACVAWLNDVETWKGTKAALDYIGLTYLRWSCTHEDFGTDDATYKVANGAAGAHAELLKPGTSEPSSWFSSLWTLQETALCPNLQLCTRGMEILVDGSGTPISLSTLFSLVSTSRPPSHMPLSKDIDYASMGSWARPKGVHALYHLAGVTKLSILMNYLSPMDIMVNANFRACKRSRAVAIMSALDVLDWYKARKPDKDGKVSSTGYDNDPLVLETFPLAFIQEAAQKLGSAFYTAMSHTNSYRLTTWEGMRGFGSTHVGSMMPFTETHGWQSTVYSAITITKLRKRDHESVAGWTILENGNVRLRSVGILASSEDSLQEKPINSLVAVMINEGHDSVKSDDKTDLRTKLRELAGKNSVYYAVTLHEDFGLYFGIVLQTAKIRFPAPGKRYLIKVGVFRTHETVNLVPSTDVNWIVV